MNPPAPPTLDELEAAFEQGKTAVRALFEVQAAIIRDLEQKSKHSIKNSPRYTNYKAHPAKAANPAAPSSDKQPTINQGDIYWVLLENPGESEPAIPHPHVVIQDNIINHSRIDTVVACALVTSNPSRANEPGNVLLAEGEANLPKQSVVEVSKVSTIYKTQLGQYIGTLSVQRTNQILAGMRFLHLTYFAHHSTP